tara:strand:- start:731 stop:1078 length:348 start_codon:yes stop_codon:yes gene_type:complete
MKIFLFTLLTSLVLVVGCTTKEEDLIANMKETFRQSLFDGCTVEYSEYEKFSDGCSCYADYLVENLRVDQLEKIEKFEDFFILYNYPYDDGSFIEDGYSKCDPKFQRRDKYKHLR